MRKWMVVMAVLALVVVNFGSLNEVLGATEKTKVYEVHPTVTERILSKEFLGLTPGTALPKLLLKDINGNQINLQASEQKMLIIYDSLISKMSPLEFSYFYSIYEKLAQDYAESTQVVILFKQNPPKELYQRLLDVGIIVIPNFTSVSRYFKVDDGQDAMFLVSDQKVQLTYRLDSRLWDEFIDTIDEFSKTGSVSADVKDYSVIELNKELPEIPFRNINNEPVGVEQFAGQTTVLLYGGRVEDVSPIIKSLRATYQDKIHIVLIWVEFSDKNFENMQECRSYADTAPNSNSYTPITAKEYYHKFDYEKDQLAIMLCDIGELNRHWNISSSGVWIILDKTQKVKGVLASGWTEYYSKQQVVEKSENVNQALEEIIDSIR